MRLNHLVAITAFGAIALAACGTSATASDTGKRTVPAAGRWPLYTFAGDSKPGDVNGEGTGGMWFAAGTTGKLIKSAPAAAPDPAPSTMPGY